MRTPSPVTGALLATAGAACAGYVALSWRVARGATDRADDAGRAAVRPHATPRARRLAEATGHIGTWYAHVPLALVGGAALLARGRRAAAGALVASSLGAAALSRVLDRAPPHPPLPPGKQRTDPDAETYPSGHALEPTATGLTATWVLARERLAPAAVLAPLAGAVGLVAGAGRLVVDRHWLTDAAAGYLAAIALAAAAAAGYELAR